MGIFSRLRDVWPTFVESAEPELPVIVIDLRELESRFYSRICPAAEIGAIKARIEKLAFTATLLELPMALIDEINKLSSDIDAALAAKDQAAAQTVADLATANNTIADLNAQIQAATDAVVAEQGKLEPSPPSTSDSTTATA